MALPRSISRRHMLILGGVAAAAAALPGSLAFIEHESGTVADDLISMLSDPQGAAEIGQRWVEAAGREPNTQALAHKIAKRLRAHGWHPGAAPEEMRAALAARIRHDFEHGDMVDVSGWQISRTSAELCALAAANRASLPA
ncbi:MAG: hypothetical protein P4L72_08895 [Parvibaculum sp.]|uniref:hypothetical protein n=1 Tax=Parvibaculum sp. TaxID=2024848 RepID=UPI00284149BA|nr:hypothetical protein [Parvibaculum sp.]MDR3499329.1 hypothetical protein [Parvibaculum sp.]